MSNYWDKLMSTDDHAASYMATYGEGPGSETRHLIGSFINDGEHILDAGCGPGWNFDHFVEHGPIIGRYKGLDYSKRFVKVANNRIREKTGLDDSTLFEVGDVRNLKEPDGSWDVVILQDVLEHTNGYEKPIEEALRVARRRVIVTFWRGFNEHKENKINDDGDDGYGADYSKDLWEEFLDGTGYFWTETETEPDANRWHIVYVIDKEA